MRLNRVPGIDWRRKLALHLQDNVEYSLRMASAQRRCTVVHCTATHGPRELKLAKLSFSGQTRPRDSAGSYTAIALEAGYRLLSNRFQQPLCPRCTTLGALGCPVIYLLALLQPRFSSVQATINLSPAYGPSASSMCGKISSARGIRALKGIAAVTSASSLPAKAKCAHPGPRQRHGAPQASLVRTRSAQLCPPFAGDRPQAPRTPCSESIPSGTMCLLSKLYAARCP